MPSEEFVRLPLFFHDLVGIDQENYEAKPSVNRTE